jgi:hypothetical protein
VEAWLWDLPVVDLTPKPGGAELAFVLDKLEKGRYIPIRFCSKSKTEYTFLRKTSPSSHCVAPKA